MNYVVYHMIYTVDSLLTHTPFVDSQSYKVWGSMAFESVPENSIK